MEQQDTKQKIIQHLQKENGLLKKENEILKEENIRLNSELAMRQEKMDESLNQVDELIQATKKSKASFDRSREECNEAKKRYVELYSQLMDTSKGYQRRMNKFMKQLNKTK